MKALRLTVVENSSALTKATPAWESLWEESAALNFFLSPTWCLAWWRHFGSGRQLRVVCAYEDEKMVGLWPLFEERVWRSGLLLNRWAFLGDGPSGADYLDALAPTGKEAVVVRALAMHVHAGSWDLLELDGIDGASPALSTLADLFPAGPSAERQRVCEPRFVCPHVRCVGTFDSFLAASGRAENLRRRERWFAPLPGFRIEVTQDPAAVPVALEHFFTLHAARWSADGGSDGIRGDALLRFHREVADRLAARGELRLYTLFCADRALASVYAIHAGRKLLYYQSGYDPVWRNKSPGLVLLGRVMRDAFEWGCTELDFLRGSEPYKFEWAQASRQTVCFTVRASARARLAAQGASVGRLLRRSTQRVLGERAVHAVRTWRPAGESL